MVYTRLSGWMWKTPILRNLNRLTLVDTNWYHVLSCSEGWLTPIGVKLLAATFPVSSI